MCWHATLESFGVASGSKEGRLGGPSGDGIVHAIFLEPLVKGGSQAKQSLGLCEALHGQLCPSPEGLQGDAPTWGHVQQAGLA